MGIGRYIAYELEVGDSVTYPCGSVFQMKAQGIYTVLLPCYRPEKPMRLMLDPKREIDAVLLQYRRVFGYIVFFSAIINILQLVPTIYMMSVFDRVMNSRNETTLLLLTIMAVGMFVMNGIIEWVRNLVMIKISAGFDRHLGERAFTAAYERSLKDNVGNPAQVLSDLSTLRQFLTGPGLLALLDIPWIPLFLGLAYLFHPWLGLFTTVGALLIAGLTVYNETITRDEMAEANRLSGKAAGYVNTTLQNPEVIQAMGMLGVMQRRLLNYQFRVVQLQASASDKGARITAATKFVRAVWQATVMALGVLMVLEEQITMGMMMGVGLLFSKAMGPMETAVASWKQMGYAKSSYDRLTQLLSEYPMQASKMPLPPPTGVIKVEQLVVVPPGAPQPVVNGVTLNIEKGEVLAIIGPSASGKSSLARALVGVWRAARGSVRYDGADVSQWDREALGPHMGYLPQDIELFDGSVAENIARFGQVDPEKVIEAARNAGIHEMVLHFPKGYDTMLGVGGIKLSGGQRQRIALARAMYDNPPIVVLDEPNSNLDEAGDAALIKAIKGMKQRGTTVILVTHRPSILGVVDKLLYLKEGLQHLWGPRDQVLKALMPPAGGAPAGTPAQPQTAPPRPAATPLRPVPTPPQAAKGS